MEKLNLTERFGDFEGYKEYYNNNPVLEGSLQEILGYRNRTPRIAWMSRVVNSTKGESMLDIGCNTGCVSLHYALTGMKVVGIDIASKAINLCNKFCKDGKAKDAQYLTTSYEEAKIEGKFDYVIVSEIIEHVFDPMKLLDFAEEHCSGIVLVTTPNSNGEFGWDNKGDTGHEHVRLYGEDEFTKIIESRGKIIDKLVNKIIHIAYEPK